MGQTETGMSRAEPESISRRCQLVLAEGRLKLGLLWLFLKTPCRDKPWKLRQEALQAGHVAPETLTRATRMMSSFGRPMGAGRGGGASGNASRQNSNAVQVLCVGRRLSEVRGQDVDRPSSSSHQIREASTTGCQNKLLSINGKTALIPSHSCCPSHLK